MPSSINNISVLKSSNLFFKIAQGTAIPANYIIQKIEYNMLYYLADGIYPKWSTIFQIMNDLQGPSLHQDKNNVGKMLNEL